MSYLANKGLLLFMNLVNLQHFVAWYFCMGFCYFSWCLFLFYYWFLLI